MPDDSVEEVVIASYAGQLEAEMWVELLKNEGIPAVLGLESDS